MSFCSWQEVNRYGPASGAQIASFEATAASNEVSGLVIKDDKRVKQFGEHTNVLEVFLNNIGCKLVSLLEVGSFVGAGR